MRPGAVTERTTGIRKSCEMPPIRAAVSVAFRAPARLPCTLSVVTLKGVVARVACRGAGQPHPSCDCQALLASPHQPQQPRVLAAELRREEPDPRANMTRLRIVLLTVTAAVLVFVAFAFGATMCGQRRARLCRRSGWRTGAANWSGRLRERSPTRFRDGRSQATGAGTRASSARPMATRSASTSTGHRTRSPSRACSGRSRTSPAGLPT